MCGSRQEAMVGHASLSRLIGSSPQAEKIMRERRKTKVDRDFFIEASILRSRMVKPHPQILGI
jgi:hypothetical protein